MSFIDGFYRFIVDLNNSNSDLYTRLQFKVGKHPEESLEQLIKKICVYMFCYEEGLELSPGKFDQKLPAIWKHDMIEQITNWTEVGLPDKKKIQLAAKQNAKAKLSVFLLSTNEIFQFCQYLKGSVENWISNINFYLLDNVDLSPLTKQDTSSYRLTVNIFDSTMYIINENEETIIAEFEKIDIWSYYQESIANNF